jgi:hypothetical protein
VAEKHLRSSLEGLLLSGLNALTGLGRHFAIRSDGNASLRVTVKPLRSNPEVFVSKLDTPTGLPRHFAPRNDCLEIKY